MIHMLDPDRILTEEEKILLEESYILLVRTLAMC